MGNRIDLQVRDLGDWLFWKEQKTILQKAERKLSGGAAYAIVEIKLLFDTET